MCNAASMGRSLSFSGARSPSWSTFSLHTHTHTPPSAWLSSSSHSYLLDVWHFNAEHEANPSLKHWQHDTRAQTINKASNFSWFVLRLHTLQSRKWFKQPLNKERGSRTPGVVDHKLTVVMFWIGKSVKRMSALGITSLSRLDLLPALQLLIGDVTYCTNTQI